MNTCQRITLLVAAGGCLFAALAAFKWRISVADRTDPHTLMAPKTELAIVRRPPPLAMMLRRGALAELPHYNPTSGRGWQVDLRCRDLGALDVADRLADLVHADFDTRTRWPAKLPAAFDPAQTLATGKNPGLGVRTLHARGITGRGVGLGIVDQTLLVTHAEYRDRLRHYEEIHLYGQEAQMHGPAVASLAVGKNVGVAPGADLYYIAETHGTYSGKHDFNWDFGPLAAAINRLLDLNEKLPAERKIRVISASIGWRPDRKGYAEVTQAVARATRDRVFIVSTAIERTHRLSFQGLGRRPGSDPDKPESYGPAVFWAPAFWGGETFAPGEKLLVPMDARTVASPTGDKDYAHYADGAWSWAVPWIAGLYALACQVRPDLTPERFWAEALRTGTTITVRNGSVTFELGTIANPVALIAALEGS